MSLDDYEYSDIERAQHVLNQAILNARKWIYVLWTVLIGLAVLYSLFSRVEIWLRCRVHSHEDIQKIHKRSHWTLLRKFKKVMMRPLFGKNHQAITKIFGFPIGVVPTVGQSIALLLYLGFNLLAVCFDYNTYEPNPLFPGTSSRRQQLWKYAALRSGMLAFGLAGRNSVLLSITGIHHSTLNTLHRWAGRLTILFSIVHTICYLMLYSIQSAPLLEQLRDGFHHRYFRAGVVGLCAALVLLTHSLSFLRRRWYEIFLISHILLVCVLLVASLLHTIWAKEPISVTIWVWIGIGLFSIDHIARLARFIYYNSHSAYASLTLVAGNAIQVELVSQRRLIAGSHIYLYCPKLSWYQSHPFTIISVEKEEEATNDSSFSLFVKDGVDSSNSSGTEVNTDKKEVSLELSSIASSDLKSRTKRYKSRLIIRASPGGFTGKLWNYAYDKDTTIRMFFEGGYGNHSSISRCLPMYSDYLLVSGGVGVTRILPLARLVLETRKSVRTHLVLVVRTLDELSWLDDDLRNLTALSKQNPGSMLEVQCFITSNNVCPTTILPSIPTITGRPVWEAMIIDFASQSLSGAVLTCGSFQMMDELRYTISKIESSVDFYEL